MKKLLFLLAFLPALAWAQTLDMVSNGAMSRVSQGYSASATTIVLDDASDFMDPDTAGAYNVAWYNSSQYSFPTSDPNFEIVRVTAKSGDTLTVTRGQEGYSATTKNATSRTYRIYQPVTAMWYNAVRDSVRYAVSLSGASLGDSITAHRTELDALWDTTAALRGDIGSGGGTINVSDSVNQGAYLSDTTKFILYSDTTSLVAMQWDLDADRSALGDTAAAIRGDFPAGDSSWQSIKANIIQPQDSNAVTIDSTLTVNGRVGIGVAVNGLEQPSGLSVSVNEAPSTHGNGNFVYYEDTPTGADGNNWWVGGIFGLAELKGAYSTSHTLYGILGSSKLRAAGSVYEGIGVLGEVISYDAGGSGTNLAAFSAQAYNNLGTFTNIIAYDVPWSSAGGTATNAYGLRIHDDFADVGASNLFGIYIGDMDGGLSTNYSIFTKAGQVHLGDDVDIDSSLTVDGQLGIGIPPVGVYRLLANGESWLNGNVTLGGHIWGADSTYDLGLPSINRFRHLYLAGNITSPTITAINDSIAALRGDIGSATPDSSWVSASVSSHVAYGLTSTPTQEAGFGLLYAASGDSLPYWRKPNGDTYILYNDTSGAATGLAWSDTVTTLATQWHVDSLGLALADTASAIRGDFPDISGMIPYGDTTSVVAMQWELDNDKQALVDTASAIRGDFPSLSGYVQFSDTTSTIASLSALIDTAGAIRSAIGASEGITYGDTVSVIATQWHVDSLGLALADTASAIRGDFPSISGLIPYSDTTSVIAMQWELDAKVDPGDLSEGAYLSDTTKFILYSDTTTLVAMQWELNGKQNTIGNLADTSKYIEYQDTTSLVAMQWELDKKQATITNLADTSKYVEFTDTSSTIASLSALIDSSAAIRSSIAGSEGIPYSDTTSLIAMQWELDNDKQALIDTAAAIRGDFPSPGSGGDSSWVSVQFDTTYGKSGNWVYVGDSLNVLGRLTANNLYEAGDTTGWSSKDTVTNVLAIQDGKIYSIQKEEKIYSVAISDETTNITTGTAKITFRMPFKAYITKVRASLSTASSSGNPAFDINEGGTTIFSTTLTIDANEKTSTTAATAAVISDHNIADDAEMTIDIDTAGTGAKGAKITIYYLIVP